MTLPVKTKSLPPLDVVFDAVYADSTSPSGLRNARTRGRFVKGSVSGSLRSNGYWSTCINGEFYSNHRLVMYMRCGADLVDMTVDHIDRNKQNNHPFNLRWLDWSGQLANRASRYKAREGRLKGVTFRKNASPDKAWIAKIWIREKEKHLHLGCFSSEEKAHEAYLEAARQAQLQQLNRMQ